MELINTNQPLYTIEIGTIKQFKRYSEKLAQLGMIYLQDILFHFPLRYEDKTSITAISNIIINHPVQIEGYIQSIEKKYRKGKQSLTCTIADHSGAIQLYFLHIYPVHLKQLAVNQKIRCFGNVKLFGNQLSMTHPQWRILNPNELHPLHECLTPIYPTINGLKQATLLKLRDFVFECINQYPQIWVNPIDHQPPKPKPYLSLLEALKIIHYPKPQHQQDNEQMLMLARNSVAFEELLTHHLFLKLIYSNTHQKKAYHLPVTHDLKKLFNTLPFTLTQSQQNIWNIFSRALRKNQPMLRLLQGDVGSGKTILAVLAAAQAAFNHYQVAMMVPTEILANQHYHYFTQLLAPFNIKIAYLYHALNNKKQNQIKQNIADGSIKIIIGTQSLIQKEVVFFNLGLIIIDEQHRFGVNQRLLLYDKGIYKDYYPHLLVMTATPIPRTLTMISYADLQCETIKELPPNRKPINTLIIQANHRNHLIQRLKIACTQGEQAYWVCTLVDHNTVMDAKAAKEVAVELSEKMHPLKVGLIHGQLKASEKQNIIQAFKNHQINLLVATTVIEVGIDVPNASLMVIENPERLGLAQLHQLRGRIGRGTKPSTCLLLCELTLNEITKKRIEVIRKETDGFKIAEQDQLIRGPGEIFGTKQAGVKTMKIANLSTDQKIAEAVIQYTKIVHLSTREIKQLKHLWIGHYESEQPVL